MLLTGLGHEPDVQSATSNRTVHHLPRNPQFCSRTTPRTHASRLVLQVVRERNLDVSRGVR